MVKNENVNIDITDLEQLPGIGSNTSQKLKDGGILTIMGIATSTPGLLKDAAGITEASARKLINAARDLCKLGFESGTEIASRQDSTEYIPTLCKSIDTLLGGGLKLGTTWENYGEFATGKTQLGHVLAVNCIKKFPTSSVIWIDNERTFSAKRITELSKGAGLDPALVLSHIKVGTSYSSDHQVLITESIEKEILDNKLDVKLIVIDSIMNHFRAEYPGRAELANRQQRLNLYLHKLSTLVANYKMAVYLTNQVQSDPGQMFGSPIKPIGGTILGHFSHIRTQVRRGQKGSRVMRLVDSPDLAEGEANFIIKEDCLESIDE